MGRFLGYIFLLAVGFSPRASAQLLVPVPINYTHNAVPKKTFDQPVLGGRNRVYLYFANSYSPAQAPFNYNFKYTLPKGAIFCRMEDAIYNRLNFWVKFRMGTDERYSN